MAFRIHADRMWSSQHTAKGISRLRDSQFVLLTQAAREGDRSALGHLLDSFRSYLRLFSDRKLGPDLKPKCGESDLVQQTFLDAQQAFPRFTGSKPHELRAWLERIFLNNLGDMARRFRTAEKRQIGREIPLPNNGADLGRLADHSTPSKNLVAREEQDRLQRALARLPDDYRRVIAMRNLERCKFEDIATAMGRSTAAVKKLWSRAIVQLKEQMKDHGRFS